jgi:hypothetical protein
MDSTFGLDRSMLSYSSMTSEVIHIYLRGKKWALLYDDLQEYRSLVWCFPTYIVLL